MAHASVAHDDGAYDVRMAAQADVYVEELDEEDPVFDVAVEIQDTEGISFVAAYARAGPRRA